MGHGADALGGVFIVVIADGGVGIQGLHEANDTADELGAVDRAGEFIARYLAYARRELCGWPGRQQGPVHGRL